MRRVPDGLAEVHRGRRRIRRTRGRPCRHRRRPHRVIGGPHRVRAVVQLQRRRAEQAQAVRREGQLHLDRLGSDPHPVRVHPCRQGLQHPVGEALARMALDIAVARAVAGVAGQHIGHRLDARIGAGQPAAAAILLPGRAVQQRGGGEDIGFRVRHHQPLAHAQQSGALAHLVVEALAPVQPHYAVRGWHVPVPGLLGRVGGHVGPAGFRVGDRLQHPARDAGIARIGALEVAGIVPALVRQRGQRRRALALQRLHRRG